MLAGGGMVMDSGAHYCDTIRYLFGDPETVYARAHQIADRKVSKAGKIVDDDNEDTCVATIDAEIGLRAKAICEAIYESNACGQVVNYDDVVAGKVERYQKPINAHWGL